MIESFSFDLQLFISNIGRLLLAFLIALPVALDREYSTRIMGLRSFPIMAMGSCAYFLVALRIFGENSDPMARVFQGLIQGIGFLGTAAIIKRSSDKDGDLVRGTATAASIWTMGVIGAATAYGFYEIAVAVSGVNFLTLHYLSRFKG